MITDSLWKQTEILFPPLLWTRENRQLGAILWFKEGIDILCRLLLEEIQTCALHSPSSHSSHLYLCVWTRENLDHSSVKVCFDKSFEFTDRSPQKTWRVVQTQQICRDKTPISSFTYQQDIPGSHCLFCKIQSCRFYRKSGVVPSLKHCTSNPKIQVVFVQLSQQWLEGHLDLMWHWKREITSRQNWPIQTTMGGINTIIWRYS